jgi:hypothetical protein
MDLVAVIEERVCNVGPDEAGAAGNQRVHKYLFLLSLLAID